MAECSNSRNISANGQLPPIQNMPEWFKQYLRHVGPIPISQVPLAPPQNLLMAEAPPRVIDFPKLCKDFQNMGGKCFNKTEPYNEAIAWITNCKRITRAMG